MKETTVFVLLRVSGVVAASLVFAPACALSDAGHELSADTSAEIQRGVRETGRVPIVSYGTVCTATFISRARCLITASHCSGGSLVMGPDVNGSLQDPNLRTSYSRRSLSLRDFTTPPRYQGGSFDSSPADDIRILWSNASKEPGPHTIDHRRDYTPLPLDFGDAGGQDGYTVHGYGFNVCDETGDGILRYGTFRGNGFSNATGAAIANVRNASTRTLLKISGLSASGGRYGICAGDSGAAIRSSAGVRAVVGWSLNGSNDGLGTALGAYRPWFERNVIGSGAKFCNPNWGLTVRGPASVALSIDGGVVVERRGGGGDVDPWDPQAEESPRTTVASGVRVRVRGADPLEPVHARIEAQVDATMALALRWPAGACAEATSASPDNQGNRVCTVTLEPTNEESMEVGFEAR